MFCVSIGHRLGQDNAGEGHHDGNTADPRGALSWPWRMPSRVGFLLPAAGSAESEMGVDISSELSAYPDPPFTIFCLGYEACREVVSISPAHIIAPILDTSQKYATRTPGLAH